MRYICAAVTLRLHPLPPSASMGVACNSTSISLIDPETGKGRITYLCEGVPERPFPPTPGLWFSNQPHEVQDILFAAFKQCAYPSTAEMEALAAQVKAPSTAQLVTFYDNMRVRDDL